MIADEIPTPIVPEIIDENCLKFWEGVREKKLLLGHCTDCGEWHFYPRQRCPRCRSSAVELAPASGNATLLSYTAVYRPGRPSVWPVPYVLGFVKLAEGPRLLTVMNCDEDACAIGMPVTLGFRSVGSGDGTVWLHHFTPVRA